MPEVGGSHELCRRLTHKRSASEIVCAHSSPHHADAFEFDCGLRKVGGQARGHWPYEWTAAGRAPDAFEFDCGLRKVGSQARGHWPYEWTAPGRAPDAFE